MDAIAGFLDQYAFGHDRAELLAAQLPATTAEHAEARARQQTHLRAELARIETAERGLISELEAPADPADPAIQAYRARIRARVTDLYAERTRTEANLAELAAAAPGQRPLPARPAPCRRPGPSRRAAPDQRSPAGRVRHPGPLPQRQEPGHHLGHPHRKHTPHHHRPASRPPHRQRHRHPSRRGICRGPR